jgi:signal transduction histidine kinase
MLLAALLFWALYKIRMRQVAAALNARFDERLTERTRLARELHDTLLQTLEASKLVADTALSEPPDVTRARGTLQRLSDWLEHAVHEGRAALNSLRSHQRNDLAGALRHEAERHPGSMEVVVCVDGEVKEIHPIVRDEISQIGNEAIRNARRHANASRLEIELCYGADLTLRIRDNGKGIAAVVLEHGKEGHFGLQGLRERVASIGGTIDLVSVLGSGTNMTLVVPGRVAFR